MSVHYDADFFAVNVEGALQSARVVVPIVMDLIKPASVIDAGCGLGAWLRAFQENGVAEVRGLDGVWVDQSRLLIERAAFAPVDLGRAITIDRSYDLAVCLEVLEHLPVRNNRRFIEMLTKAAPVVLFSSAIPGQGGAGHTNEQWPCYWRQLFAAAGFEMLDPIRPQIMRDERVAWWYRQNVVMFAAQTVLSRSPRLRDLANAAAGQDLQWVHVEMLHRYRSLGCIVRQAPGAVWRVINRRYLKRETADGPRK